MTDKSRTIRYGFRVVGRAVKLYTQRKAHHWTATITLFSFLMIFPLAIFLTALAQIIDPKALANFLSLWMPEQAVHAIIQVLSNAKTPHWMEFIFSILVGIWGLSHILHSIIEISDEFYEYHKRHFWHRRILAILTLGVLLTWQFITMIAYSVITWVGRWVLTSGLFPGPRYLVHLIHWSTMLVLLLLQWVSLMVIYAMAGPNFKFREYMPGALFAAVLGWLANRLLIYYIRIAPVQDFYGALTNFFVFLVWVYWESTIFIIGIGVNRVVSHDRFTRSQRVIPV